MDWTKRKMAMSGKMAPFMIATYIVISPLLSRPVIRNVSAFARMV